MKIFSAAQIKQWDVFTIENEPISSINLMERAATACYNWLVKNELTTGNIHIFCGKGNNGGDGLAIAAALINNHSKPIIHFVETGKKGSADFETNLQRLTALKATIYQIENVTDFPVVKPADIIIDALFGTGLNKPVTGVYKSLTEHINQSGAPVISIDMPSGLYADESSINNAVVRATHTLCFQNYKLAFLLPENEQFCGWVHLLAIGLHPAFEKDQSASFEMIDSTRIKSIYKPRPVFAHKGNFGNAALLCGSMGMMGAAVLASLACMRSGVGKLTSYVPKCGYNVLQTSVPEAMCIVAGEDYLLSAPEIEKFDAVGIGPGIGLQPSHKNLVQAVFEKTKKPLVLDADALNTIATFPELLNLVPPYSIFTPHPKEFERLFGKTNNQFERLQLALQKCEELNIYIVLKGHFSFICTPTGKGYFNSTGNAGMATAGSGDVLTGIITGLLAQGYSPLESALFAVYLHGHAADIAASKSSQEALIAGDIIVCLGAAFKTLGPQM